MLLPRGVGGADPIPNLMNQVDLTGSLCYCLALSGGLTLTPTLLIPNQVDLTGSLCYCLAVSGGLVYAFAAPSATVHVFSTLGTPRE